MGSNRVTQNLGGVNKIPYGLCENGGYIDRPCIMKEVYGTGSCHQQKIQLTEAYH